MGVHDGHRKRMRTRFLEHGADTMEDHALLELLLYYACPRVDTNPLAHRLLEHFGGIHQVLEIPLDASEMKLLRRSAETLREMLHSTGRP